ncbi:uncharacterized protein LOC133822358 [Humulus lupulus]|uniref:uncharacterized protein LOC133822358 n=1 Tax=Humulus lupulus TaxID=3486 RepID=UPI002B416C5D|nr:uncharacterized protein LOC133822358 [Humulus lupulus]
MRNRILDGGYLFFGRKPLIMKPWNPVDDFSKEDIDSIPTWVQLGGLDLKYWGERSLFKIVGQIGKPIQVDAITRNRDRLAYPRILIEVTMKQEFPARISFWNELDQEVDIFVEYEWKPTICTNCSGLGHEAHICRKNKAVKQEWVPKQRVSEPNANKATVDEDGFQTVTKGAKIHASTVNQTIVNNKFGLLDGDSEIEFQQKHREIRQLILSKKVGLVPNKTGRFLVTFVYGYNVESFREQLWKDLQDLAGGITEPWMVIGDFNEILSLQDRIGKKTTTKLSKAVFLPEGVFDHSPILVHFSFEIQGEKKPFRYFRMWKEAPGYEEKIRTSWNFSVVGSPMFQVVSKLKRLKQVLLTINREGFSDIQQTEFKAGLALKDVQEQLQKDPFNDRLITQEQLAREQFLFCHKAYLSFLAQKAKVAWMVNGDENTHVFHASLKARRIQNRILSIKTEAGVWVDSPTDIKKAFLDYYKSLLGTTMVHRKTVSRSIMKLGPILNAAQVHNITRGYSTQEVKAVMFGIPGLKALGPDGFSSYFYQDNWTLVGSEVTTTVLPFLNSGKLLKEINNTAITLIPKNICPDTVCDFRPISCCNVIYKVASKMICSRIWQVLPEIIAENQGGFVHGRYIAHNIMICQDLVRYYGRQSCRPSCMIKLDLRKAYDTIEWDFIEEMLTEFQFPQEFIQLIMVCVRSPRFSLMINGSLNGFFEAKRGLRQGDPLSPLLFVLGMEYLSRIMLKVSSSPGYKFHDRCASLKLNHLCFADDILLFGHGDFVSILWMLRGLKIFSKTSGLFPNEAKSAIYCSGMSGLEIDRVVQASGFSQASLPFRYLGIPICSKRITNVECGIILEKMVARIQQWRSRNLSYSARAIMINSVLLSIHSYWAQIMVLPKKLLKDIEAICRAFLWKGVADSHSPGAVAWSTVCTPKSAGGLGFRRILEWNLAALGKYVWAIASKKDNLWVRWIHSIYLKSMDWWTYPVQQNCSWYWRKIIAIKELFRAKMDRSSFIALKYSVQTGHSILYDQKPSKQCLVKMKEWLGCRAQTENLYKLLQWFSKVKYFSKLRRRFCIAAVSALVYHLWRVRNDALWSCKIWQVNHTLERIKTELKLKLTVLMCKGKQDRDNDWIQKL